MLADAQITPILPVEDMVRARKFYEEILGLRPISESESGVMYEGGKGTMLYIYQREATKAEHTVAGFAVEDVEMEVAALRSKGVVFEEYDLPGLKTENNIATIGTDKVAWFKDTEGNILAIVHMSK